MNSVPRRNASSARRRSFKPALGLAFALLAAAGPLCFLAGCSTKATFPKETVEQSITDITKTQYGLDVAARVSGKTIGVQTYVDRLVDPTGNMDQEVVKKTIGDLVLTVTRVALSTDAEMDFVVVVIRGIEDLNEIRITRSLVDIKKAQTEALSVEESLNRTLWEQSKFQPDLQNPYDFPLQDMPLDVFLQKQIVQRVRFANQTKQEGGAAFLPTELIDGKVTAAPEGRVFEFSIVSFESVAPEINVMKVLKVAADVIGGYRFEDFDLVVVKDLLARKMLIVDKATLMKYGQKRMDDAEVLRLGMKDDFSESERLRNALEIFGFNFQ